MVLCGSIWRVIDGEHFAACGMENLKLQIIVSGRGNTWTSYNWKGSGKIGLPHLEPMVILISETRWNNEWSTAIILEELKIPGEKLFIWYLCFFIFCFAICFRWNLYLYEYGGRRPPKHVRASVLLKSTVLLILFHSQSKGKPRTELVKQLLFCSVPTGLGIPIFTRFSKNLLDYRGKN